MAGPKNPEQLRGALGAFRRRLQEAERPKDPVLDLQVDRGLDPSKAPVPVAPASPRFQAPMIPEEPDLPPVSSGAYKGVEDIANRVINTPTDRRGFMKGVGQTINALKFMNSPLAKMVGKMVPEEAAAEALPHDKALLSAFRDMVKSAGLTKKYIYDVDNLPVDDQGNLTLEAKHQGSNLADAIFDLAKDLSSQNPSEIAKRSTKEHLALKERFAQLYEKYAGKPLEEDYDNRPLFRPVFDLMDSAMSAYGNLDWIQARRPEDINRASTRPGINAMEDWLQTLTEQNIRNFKGRQPTASREDIYNSYDGSGSNVDHYYEIRQLLADPRPENLEAYQRRRSLYNLPKVEELQEDLRKFENMKELRDDLFPEFRERFNTVYDRLAPEFDE
jgi:hypothetical protein